MGKVSSITTSTYVILVTLIIFTYVELSQSCHRRVEYHQYYKKKPHKGHGGGHGHGGYGHGHGGGGYGHGGGGHKGYGHYEGWEQHKGYEEPHGHYGGGHHGGGGHKGYGEPHGHGGGGHKGYGEPPGHYGGGHHGGGGHKGYGGGHHGGGGHKGYGGGHHGGGGHKGYGEPSHGGYHGDDGYGHGHGHDEYGGGHDEGYGGGGHGHGYGQGKGHNNKGQKGRKYKYQMYESMHYNDKGGHQPSHGYGHSSPHYMQKGYGHSGPYPNTEYSNPASQILSAPTGPYSYSGDIGDYGTPPQLDAADTADRIRDALDPNENELARHPTDNSRGQPLPETNVDPSSGNFDLNLEYHSDLPAPFRRNKFKSPSGLNDGRIRKKISSKFRDDDVGALSSELSQDEDADGSHPRKTPISGGTGPDYLENDTNVGASGTVASKVAKPADVAKMNF